MSEEKKTARVGLPRKFKRLAPLWTLVVLSLSAQVNPPQPKADPSVNDKVAETLHALETGNLAEANIDLLVKTGTVQAIPDLKKQFALTEDDGRKGRIASALIRLGDKDPRWWDYLAGRAAEAVSRNAPSDVDYDSNGKMIQGMSPKFLTWAKIHSLTAETALEKTDLDSIAVVALAESRDPRAIPLLRQALLSPNYLVEIAGSKGLAQLHDKTSIPLIVGACEAAPAEAAFAVATGLLDFHTPEAEDAAKRFSPPQPLK